jgi:CPA1 family monovalent cation:H+ antiporter
LQAAKEKEIDSEFARYQRELVQFQLESIQEQIDEMLKEHPELQAIDMEQLQEKMLDIEADTYAEFIRSGRLNERLSPLLQGALIEADEKLLE